MKNSGSPPPPPDPTVTANAQSAANIQTAIANARLNRINQTTPFGSLTYTQTGTDANGVPIYESHIALSPQQQALLDAQQSGQLTRSQMANSILSKGSGAISKPLDFSSLATVYDPYSANHQWGTPAAGSPGPGPGPAPAATPGPSTSSPASPQAAALAQMLRSQATPSATQDNTQGANPGIAGAPAAATGDPFGTWGNLNSMIGTDKPDTSKLPPDIAAQLQDDVRVDEGGATSHNYSFNENPWGGFKDSDGKYYVQVGGPNGNGAGDGGVKDPSKIIYKPGAGYVTTPDNLNDYGKGGVDWRMVAAVLGAGALGGAAGLGAPSSLGGVAATDAAESGGTLALNAAGTGVSPYVGSAAAGAAPSALTGTMDSAGSSGFGGTAALGDGLPPVTDLSVQAQQPSVWSQMLQNLQSGKGLLGHGGMGTRVGGSLIGQLLRNGQGAKK